MSSSHNIRLTGELSTPTSSSFYTFLYVFHFSGFYLSIFLELLPTCFVFSWLKDTFLVPDTLPDFRLIIKLYSRLSPGQSGLLDHIFAHLALALEPLEIGIELRNKYCQQTRLDAEWKKKEVEGSHWKRGLSSQEQETILLGPMIVPIASSPSWSHSESSGGLSENLRSYTFDYLLKLLISF